MIPESVFLTGGTGYLGRHLRELLADRDWEVTILSRSREDVDLRPNERLMVGDVTDERTFDLTGHDTVMHLAAFTDVNESFDTPAKPWRVNADGTANVLEAARNEDVSRFLYTSTSRVYGRPEYLPIDESHPTKPLDPYSASKLAGDRLALTYGNAYDFSVVIARPFNSFGRGQPKTNVAAVIVNQVKHADRIELHELSASRDFLHVSDTVAGIIRILTRGGSGEVYNIGRGNGITVGNLAEKAVAVSDRDLPIVTRNENQRDDAVSIPRNVADSSKLRALGWEPEHSVEEGMGALLNG